MKARVVPFKALNLGLTYVLLTTIGLFAVFPFLWTFAISITDKTVASGVSIFDFPQSLFPKAITFNNFIEVYRVFGLEKYLLNSVIISFATVLGTLLVSAMAAYPLSKMVFVGRDLIFGAMLATLVLPSETNFIVNVLTLNKIGLLGT